MTVANRLPADFADLEPFVEHWDVASSQERWIRRSETPLAAIRTFYDAMLARADAALAYVERYPLHALPPDAACLMRLLLSMTQAAMAIELHDSPRVPRSPFPHSITIEQGVSPFG
jgi:hypothetical protein